MRQMFIKDFLDGAPRTFTIQRESYDWFVVEDECGVRWRLALPNSVWQIIKDLKEERKVSSAVGFTITGQMPLGTVPLCAG